LTTAAVVWEKLAEQHIDRASCSRVGTLVDLLDIVVIAERASR